MASQMTCFQMQPKLGQGILVAHYLSGIKYLSIQSCGINVRMAQILPQPSWTQLHNLSDLKKVISWFIFKGFSSLKENMLLWEVLSFLLSVGTWKLQRPQTVLGTRSFCC